MSSLTKTFTSSLILSLIPLTLLVLNTTSCSKKKSGGAPNKTKESAAALGQGKGQFTSQTPRSLEQGASIAVGTFSGGADEAIKSDCRLAKPVALPREILLSGAVAQVKTDGSAVVKGASQGVDIDLASSAGDLVLKLSSKTIGAGGDMIPAAVLVDKSGTVLGKVNDLNSYAPVSLATGTDIAALPHLLAQQFDLSIDPKDPKQKSLLPLRLIKVSSGTTAQANHLVLLLRQNQAKSAQEVIGAQLEVSGTVYCIK